MPVVTVSKLLRDKLGDDGVGALVDLINQSLADQKNETITFVEEKFERRLSEEIGKVSQRISEMEGKLLANDAKVERGLIARISKLEISIAATRADLIKWMFIFWVGQVGVILGILFVFFKQ